MLAYQAETRIIIPINNVKIVWKSGKKFPGKNSPYLVSENK